MNSYEGGGNNNSDNNGWENILLGFGAADYTGNNNNDNNLGGGGGASSSHTSSQAASTGTYDSSGGYAAYLHATYQLNNGSQHQQPPQDGRNSAGLSVGGGGDSTFVGYNNNTAGLNNYGASSGGGYSLNIPATSARYTPQYVQQNSRYVSTENGDSYGAGSSNNSHSPQPLMNVGAPATQQYNNNLPQYSALHDVVQRGHSDESRSNNINSATESSYTNNYYGTIGGMLGSIRDPSPSPIGNSHNNFMSPSNHSLQHDNLSNLQPTPVNTNHNNTGGGGSDLDYCDALLRGLDDQSFGWLAGAFGVSTTANNTNQQQHQQHNNTAAPNNSTNHHTTAAAATNNSMNNNNNNNNGYNTNGYNNYGGGIGGGYLGEQMALPTDGGLLTTHQHQQQQQQQQQQRNSNDELNAFFKQQFAAQHQQHQAAAAITTQFANNPINTKKKAAAAPRGSNTKSRSRSTTSTTTAQQRKGRGRQPKNSRAGISSSSVVPSISSSHLPTGRDHSSLPSYQIDPLLEQVSLTVTAVSLTPLSGNEVVRHIRSRTDDVITRFLPCVDFLVNCQQELRQGLQIAQRANAAARSRNVGGSGGRRGGGMTPRQFHATYVAPLPKRFERTNDGLMAREHLRQAKLTMEQLVRDANAAIPQGCDHVKNAFLGGMRENQSWGLRKWLSKHGGAGSICNDLEEVTRHVKALNKADETTKRLASMLRPIAKQAHDRLKKDVPQAYQEQSSAHPYLPFFHRLEACLKQMATYDPEEDDVICLDLDSSDEEDAVKVVSQSPVKVSSFSHSSSTPVKKRSPVQQHQQKRSPKRKSNDDIAMTKRSRSDNFADQFFGGNGEKGGIKNEEDEDATKKEEETTKPKAANKNEPEVICLDDSSDEDEDENDTKPLAASQQQAAAQQNNSDGEGTSGLAPLDAATLSPPPPPPMQQYNDTLTTAVGGRGGSSSQQQWRCNQCTFLNDAFASKCGMCNDDDSVNNSGTDELAHFLGGSSFLEGGDSNHSFSML